MRKVVMRGLQRVVACGNCQAKFPHSQAMQILFSFTNKNAHFPLVQSMVDGFSSFPLKQMKSNAYSVSSPVNRIGQILTGSNVPCPKCNKVHWNS